MPELHVGVSGWHYESWWGPFFPKTVKKKDALPYFASRFGATELNTTHYHTPTEKAVLNWLAQTPEDFRFSWKASRYITHWKRLNANCANSLELLESRIRLLGDKAGPILFQLPPNMKKDLERLADFIAMIPRHRQSTFEFRHESWYDDDTFALLEKHDCALCLSDHADAPAPWEVTASFVYVRGHGRTGRYRGSYKDETIAQWARDIRRWRRKGHDVWCFFDNDVKSAAPRDAQRLLDSLARKPARRRTAAA